ncbi:MAG TPA: DUF2271 domain-containing protein [Cellvibrionaceae bacterium]
MIVALDRLLTNSRRALAAGLCAGFTVAAAQAAQLDVSLELPKLAVAEYHKPYVAVWLEPAAGGNAVQLAVWYDSGKANRKGEEWLKELRQWWRRAGRTSVMPIDGVTGATRITGPHVLSFTAGAAPLGTPAAGDYVLFVEAAREVGGRELVKIPFTWPGNSPQKLNATGSSELGAVSLAITP